jgi:peptidoglycan hydrolase CwlO-like protein
VERRRAMAVLDDLRETVDSLKQEVKELKGKVKELVPFW